ncbi:uncharacterized protein AMSG_05509 [Thecamonas trahens ATCC 50062]|uniref:Smr domain-containing protein n=1 Tax=Thecamonas trahens ATCC 50062 TaxID=461836 RepID=A0A0L0DDV3_THETB|nr:hypothetical protein AMSG_05509 [Thecamonas trahens ATCC 50062]KNC49493.1 hypothetical protein AMSG_05509 [Thecamonas trahens ATCC 50062]|eukprot:XP_013757912.1 hypothetical protein AMSG_05509 [Thecamonas trahens ATCC 50062]
MPSIRAAAAEVALSSSLSASSPVFVPSVASTAPSTNSPSRPRAATTTSTVHVFHSPTTRSPIQRTPTHSPQMSSPPQQQQQQQQQPPPPRPAEEPAADDIMMLCAQFPDFDPEYISDIYAEAAESRLAAADTLAQMNFYRSHLHAQGRGPAPARRVCRYYQEGGCYRSDCAFVHTDTQLSCSYWLVGSCMKGAECAFLHGLDDSHRDELDDMLASQEAAAREASEAATAAALDDAFFAPAPAPAHDAPPVPSMASKLKRAKLGEEFPRVNAGVIDEIFEAHGYNYDATKAALMAEHADGFVEVSDVVGGSRAGGRSASKRTKAKSMPWLETGDALAALYASERATAEDLARTRNHYLQQSAAAFRAGDKALAKDLSRKGRAIEDQMHEAHAIAARNIFAARNPPSLLESKKVIDLHGLHPDEAVDHLSAVLDSLIASGIMAYVLVVTGTGHHNALAKNGLVEPAVADYLAESGLVYSDASVDGRGGCLRVSLPRPDRSVRTGRHHGGKR